MPNSSGSLHTGEMYRLEMDCTCVSSSPAITAPLIDPMPPMITTENAMSTKSRPMVGNTE
ncbi:hypothetical protein D3C86_2116570 [compost metagenome]